MIIHWLQFSKWPDGVSRRIHVVITGKGKLLCYCPLLLPSTSDCCIGKMRVYNAELKG
ncbi:hypothetical protein EAM_0540 [Erwinia amylovora ATCC 49946]|nr:hypothetical protein EAM_0540 [Erwinia amylovora ATCC 49946]